MGRDSAYNAHPVQPMDLYDLEIEVCKATFRWILDQRKYYQAYSWELNEGEGDLCFTVGRISKI